MSQTVAYTHTYDYRMLPQWPGREYRPILMVEIFYNEKRLQIPALLDSGADYSIFGKELAEDILGLDFSNDKREPLSGIGNQAWGYKRNVGLQFGPLPRSVSCEVYFADDFNFALLGRKGVFSHLQIGLDEAARKVYMAVRS
jgi:hypothetical protein